MLKKIEGTQELVASVTTFTMPTDKICSL